MNDNNHPNLVLTNEQLRELGKRVGKVFPDGLGYCVVVWPFGTPEDCGYFSNAHRFESRVALEHLLGSIWAQGGSWEKGGPK